MKMMADLLEMARSSTITSNATSSRGQKIAQAAQFTRIGQNLVLFSRKDSNRQAWNALLIIIPSLGDGGRFPHWHNSQYFRCVAVTRFFIMRKPY